MPSSFAPLPNLTAHSKANNGVVGPIGHSFIVPFSFIPSFQTMSTKIGGLDCAQCPPIPSFPFPTKMIGKFFPGLFDTILPINLFTFFFTYSFLAFVFLVPISFWPIRFTQLPFSHIAQFPHPLAQSTPKEIVIERKGPSVASGPDSIGPGPGGGTPSKRSGSDSVKKTSKGPNGTQSAGHSVASPSPPPPLHPGTTNSQSQSQPSLAEGEDHQKDYRVAMFVLGGAGVGKSALVQRFIKNTFSDAYLPTIEDTYQQVITCSEQGRMAVCTLHIIDTTGSHQFPAMQRLAIQRGNAFILVYSITSRQSLEELGPIVRTLREVKGESAMVDVPIVLVGNKMDEHGRREVNQETGEALAQRWGCEFLETSAKQGRNVTELFQRLLSLEKRRHLRLAVQEIDGGEKDGNGMQQMNCAKHRKCAII